MDYNYKELVEKYFAEKTVISWNIIVRKIENNLSDGEDYDDTVTVYVEELIDCHVGSYIPQEFCSWFGIKPVEYLEGEAYGETDYDFQWDFDKLTTAFTDWMDAHKPEELKGRFNIAFAESDGSLTVYYIVDKEEMNFSDWRKAEGFKSWDAIYNDYLVDGCEYEEVQEVWNDIKQTFEDYCEGAHIKGIMDEDD